MSNLIKTNDGKLIKYTADASYIFCEGFTTIKPLPTGNNLTLSGITITEEYYNKYVSITNGDQVCLYRVNSDNTLTSTKPVSSVKSDAIYLRRPLSSDYADYVDKYYLRSTKTWSDTRPIISKLIKIN